MQFIFSLVSAALSSRVPASAQDRPSRRARVLADVGQRPPIFLASGTGTLGPGDGSRIAHPGYNMDRAPAAFRTLRLHWES